MLTRFLDWLDEAAGGLIRVAYLLAGITAVAVYFGAGHLPPALDVALNAGLPWALAFALETHTYLTARRVRAAWQDHERQALQVNLAVLVGLVAFSAWNQLGYLYGTWQPPTATPLALPIWLAYLVRALIVPTAFLAAAFLAPLAEPIAAQIENEARATLGDVFKIARKQRRRMLTEAERAGRDMTGALVDLVPDDELRRVISHAYAAIAPRPTLSLAQPSATSAPGELPTHAHEASQTHESDTPADVPLTPVEDMPAPSHTSTHAADAGSPQGGVRTPNDAQDDTPPTGPGSPSLAPVPAPTRKRSPRTSRPAVLRLTPAEPRKTRQAARASSRLDKSASQPVRTGGNESLELVARQAYAQGATSVAKMRRATGMSQTAAASWVRALKAEGATPPAQLAQPMPPYRPTPGAAFAGVLSADDNADDLAL